MIRASSACTLSILLSFSPVAAQERDFAGYGRLITNDSIGDTHDRWRTGSFAASLAWGPDRGGRLPARFGDLLEVRFNTQIITPENPSRPAPGDRNFAGILSFGLHTHFQPSEVEYSVGADLVMTGPMTGLDHFQSALHEITGGRDASAVVRSAQVSDDIKPTLVIEAGRNVGLGGAARLRPFVESRVGDETLVRAGADLVIGPVGTGELMVRAPVTGHRYRVSNRTLPGTTFVIGGDLARVSESDYLSSARGLQSTETRTRLRSGLHLETGQKSSVFYGVTWLDKEFEAQRESQVVGSVRLNFRF